MNRPVLSLSFPQHQAGSRVVQAFLWCCAVVFLVLAVLFATREKSAQAARRPLSFQQRVAYQRAIEEVYWRHRIWPKENPQPKPALATVMSASAVEAKVMEYLRQSAALEQHWQRPLTGEQLQAELERMTQHSKQPAMLREVWAALGNDPLALAECLARPALAERLLRNWSEHDERLAGQTFDEWWQTAAPSATNTASTADFAYHVPALAVPAMTCTDNTWTPTKAGVPKGTFRHSAVWTGSEMIIWGGLSPRNAILNTGGRYNPATDTWTLIGGGEVGGRYQHPAVWTGTEMIVWGGSDNVTGVNNTGGRYNPTTNAWIPLTQTNAPSPRVRHTAIWTGSEMIIWGGTPGGGEFLNTGGRYNPSNDTWTATSIPNMVAGRSQHTAIWIGSLMIVWGGAGASNSGGRYHPSTDTWTETSVTNSPSPRWDHTAVWTGSEMIIWGGLMVVGVNGTWLNTGGRYNPTTDTWIATTLTSAPNARSQHTAVWAGNEMFIWGGGNDVFPYTLNTGSRYNPALDKWTAITTTNAPGVRSEHAAIWTGTEMIVWGGQNRDVSGLNTGGRYNPSLGTWTPTNAVVEIEDRNQHTAVWTGSEMIIWGGTGIQTGGRYNPSTDSWSPTSLTNVPEKRVNHTAVWTGSEMVIAGGYSCCTGCGFTNTGGRYNPATDTWVATALLPEVRAKHTAVWTGSEMILWGGQGCPDGTNGSGNRYNPVANTWTTVTLANAPMARFLHSAVWTGNEMIIWGGEGDDATVQFNTGGRYNPTSNTWTPTATANAPSPRENHTAVWTGSEMIVWGGYFFGTPITQNTGGRYNPTTNTWTATTTTDAPSPRWEHTAVWTGDEMIVWGGIGGPLNVTDLNTGGRYNPISNSWRATNVGSAPTGRNDHTAIWTGSEMIVFGGEFGGSSDYTNTGARYCALPPPLAIAPTSKTVPGPGGTGAISVFASANLNWTAVSNAAWITITSGASGSGNGMVNFAVAANPATQPRTGTITIDAQTFTVNQEANCTTPITLNQTLNGTLVNTDCPAVQRGSTYYADQYTFSAAAGQQVAVLLTSAAFDTYVYLVNPTGSVIGENDDGGGGTNSRIPAGSGFIALPTSGTYTIEVTSANPQTTGAYTISLTAPSCAYAIAPTSQMVTASANSGTVNVTTVSGCNWTATGSDAWLTITSGSNGTGSGQVSFSVAANTGGARTGTLTIAGQTFTVNQAAACSFSILPTSQNFGATGGSNSVGVTAPAGCAWTATSNAAWITINSGAAGSGNGAVNYTVAANSGPQRNGTMTIAGQTFTVNQDSGCSFTINPTNQNYVAAGGSGNVTVNASATACAWTATSNAAWLMITSGAAGTGNGTVNYSAAANTGPARSGTLTIAGQAFTVMQAAPCSYSLLPTSQSFPTVGGVNSVSVTAASGCAWTVTSNDNWITITSGSNGTGNGTVNYSVVANAGPARTGTLTIAGQTFTVSQASGCALTLNPPNGNFSAAGGNNSLSVTASNAACSWTAVSNDAWLTITNGATGTGTGSVVYSVAANTGPARTGTLTIAGQTFTVNQLSGCSFTINPGSQNFVAGGGTGNVAVTTAAGCTWIATSNANWLTITAGASGNGPGAVQFTVAANAGLPRNGTLTIAGQTFTATQDSGCPALTINPTSLPNGTLGSTYSQTLTTNGGVAPLNYALTSGALPPGLSLSVGGLLSGSPTQLGTFNFTVTVTDANGCTGLRAYALIVSCQSIIVSPNTLPNGQIGAVYSQQLSQAGGNGTIAWSITGSVPVGITLNAANGLLAGTPTVSGTFNFTARATDMNGCFGERSYALVLNACPTLAISPNSLPGGTSGSTYSQTLTASGGTPNYNFSVNTGSTLPLGLNLSAAGLLSGTLTTAGSFNFTIRVTDVNGCSGTQAFTLVVNCPALTLNPASLPSGFVGTAYHQMLTATGGTTPYSFTVSAGALPTGLNLASGGMLTGTPTTPAMFSFTVRATDANGCQGTRVYTMTVSGTGLQFFALANPVRLLDTRLGATACSQPNAPIAGGSARTQPGRNLCTIPANAVALTGHITTVQSGGGFLTLYPSDAMQPTVANTNYGVNEIINNVFTVGLGADGAFKIFAFNTTEVVVDVTGYYAPPTTNGLFFHPLPTPVRLLETRAGQIGCITPGAPLIANTEFTQQANSACTGIPASARAIVGNATTVGPQTGGFLTLFPADAARPLVASSNFNPGQVVNGPFAVGLAANGQFKIYTTSTTDLVVDVLGYYSPEVNDANGAGLLLTPLAHPVRLLETRVGQPIGCFKPGVPLNGQQEYTQPAPGVCDGITIPATALGLVGNATVVSPSGAGFLTLWPSTALRPLVANLNYNTGDVSNRHFIVGLGQVDGAFKLYTQATSHLVVDLSGYFAP